MNDACDNQTHLTGDSNYDSKSCSTLTAETQLSHENYTNQSEDQVICIFTGKLLPDCADARSSRLGYGQQNQ